MDKEQLKNAKERFRREPDRTDRLWLDHRMDKRCGGELRGAFPAPCMDPIIVGEVRLPPCAKMAEHPE